VRLSVALWVACLLLAGCAGSNDGDALDPIKGGLEGTWDYLVTNAFEATFTGCTGDATVLEGATLYEGLSLAPICMTAVTFDVNQTGDEFLLPPHQVTCSDGASAVMTGFGLIDDSEIGGQWESTSDQGVAAVQLFTGVIVGNTIELAESSRSFSGVFQGGCDFSPPLTALVTVQ
jgi:hypothetical protein